MSQNAKIAFTFLRLVRPGSQGRSQQAFVSGDRAFGLPALAINSFGKTAFHLTPITSSGPFATATAVQRNYGRTNSQFVATQSMVMLTVVGRIAQQSVPRDLLARLSHRFGKLRRIIARAFAHDGRCPQMAARMANHCQLDPLITQKPLIARAQNVMPRRLSTLQSGGVDSRLWFLGDQAAHLGKAQGLLQKEIESPFFTSRCSA